MEGFPIMMWVPMLLYFLFVIATVATVVVVAWRWMRAHERIAESMAGIERALSSRTDGL